MKTKATKKCPIPGCWSIISEIKSMCGACTSWWYRVSLKSGEELVAYIRRVGRYAGRLGQLRAKGEKVKVA